MEQKPNNSISTPVTLEGLTFLVLLVLKLAGKSDISWWIVFSPLYLGPLLVIILGILGAAFMTAKENVQKSRAEKENQKKRQDDWLKMFDNKSKKGDNNEQDN